MTALWSGPHGDTWKNSTIQIYGWLNVGGSFSTSRAGVNPSAGRYDNFPTAYDEVPNAIEPDQEVLYIERQPNTVQTDHFDGGFRFSGLWGLDYRFTTAKGYFSQQWLGHPPLPGALGRLGTGLGPGCCWVLKSEYERSYDNPAYQNGTKTNQLTAAGRYDFLLLRGFSLN